MARTYTLVREVLLGSPLSQVFPFFADVHNLNRITPPDLNFEILTPDPVVIREGAEILYRIRIFGLRQHWKTRIDVWEPDLRFVDRQLEGPYLWWHHEHRFEACGNNTWMRDQVDYRVPGGPLAPLIHGLVIRRKLNQIFDYRTRVVEEIFGSVHLAAQALTEKP